MIDAKTMELAMMKESLLNELIVWLRAKGLFEEAMKTCPSGQWFAIKHDHG